MMSSRRWRSGRKSMREVRGPNRTIGATAISIAEEPGLPGPVPEKPHTQRPVTVCRGSDPRNVPRSAFRNWTQIRNQLRAAKQWAFFLDFDGTLVNLRWRPGDVRVPRETKLILKRLAAHENVSVVIVSGRKLQSVRKLISINGLRYFGVHGGEREDRSVVLGTRSQLALDAAKHSIRKQLGSIRGIWVEDKGLSIAVHYRGVNATTAESAATTLASLTAPWGDMLHILNGSRVWEILPKEIPGKATAVNEVVNDLRQAAAVVYVGNDGTDEVAFAVLPNQITVRVGPERRTLARFVVRSPSDVLRLLARMEKELP
jgi:trehalose 6-phosphate phosphatase